MGSKKHVRGSDPRAATCRGKLQSKRCKLNQEINKELRLRAGAENLYKATSNRKLRDTVALELSFVNSNLQLLKEQLAELNSSMEIYQSESHNGVMPMIPLGLKETKEIDFMEAFSDFILEHYSEEPSTYLDAIADITDTRQACKTPSRDAFGTALLFRYYNLLYYVERRFIPPDRNIGIFFEWYDSLTGVPSCQRTISFEKACTLFNLGAIYTQIGTRHDRTTADGLDASVDSFLRAAGIFRHIFDTFTNAPSMDLKPQVLEVLVSLMLSQARECLFAKFQLQTEVLCVPENINLFRDLAGEAAQLSTEYLQMHTNIQANNTHKCLPECWAGLVPLKAELYKAFAHYYKACSIDTSHEYNISLSARIRHNTSLRDPIKGNFETQVDMGTSKKIEESTASVISLKHMHFKEAWASYDEAQRLQRMCRYLKNKKSLTQVIQDAFYKMREEFEKLKFLEEPNTLDDECYDVSEQAIEVASSKFTLSLTGPDFTSHKVEDPFKQLGPIAIFSARRHWTAPRYIRLQKGSSTYHNSTFDLSLPLEDDEEEDDSSKHLENFGFHVRGDSPVIISNVKINSLADLGGIKEGDFLVEIAGKDVKWYSNQQVLLLIQSCGSTLDLKVITPMDRNYLQPLSTSDSIPTISAQVILDTSISKSSGVTHKLDSSISTTSKIVGVTSASPWNPFRPEVGTALSRGHRKFLCPSSATHIQYKCVKRHAQSLLSAIRY
ncbi:rhophilin-2-A isoform X3 [Drosophila bipectinata]|uniref:rhophilin-2-A isoform X3 n=1 Tax=Drosophila bipectinata TaxID=42026 RepID=UPI0038B3439C